MAEKTENTGEPIVIKKYANRRLYNTAKSTTSPSTSREMVRDGQDFVVNDAKSGDDITRGVLAQIIFEEEAKGQTMLPANFLRQLIRLYGIPCRASSRLSRGLDGDLLAKPGSDARAGAAGLRGRPGAGELRGLARSNMEWFENAMRMFAPFATGMPPKNGRRQEAGKRSARTWSSRSSRSSSPRCRPSSRSSSRTTADPRQPARRRPSASPRGRIGCAAGRP